MSTDILLFDSAGSPCARRVKITLMEKRLPFDRIELDLGAMEQKRPDYLALNPNGVVPTLAHGNLVLFEANTITRYLDEAFPETPQLYPSQPDELIEVFNWQASELLMAKRFRPLMYQRLLGPLTRLTKTKEQALEKARANEAGHDGLAWETRVWSVDVISLAEEKELVDWHHNWLQTLDVALADRPYLLGEACSMADISVAPRVGLYPAIGIALANRFPNAAGWLERMEARPSVAATKSDQDTKLQKLSKTPILPAANRLYRREGRATLKDRALVSIARPLLRKLLSKAAVKRPPFEVPAIHSRPSPEDRTLPASHIIQTFRSVNVAGSEEDPVFCAARFLADRTGATVTVQTGDSFGVDIDGSVLSAPNEALEFLAAGGQETDIVFPQTAQHSAEIRGWLAFAQGSEREFRPFCRPARGNAGPDRFVTDRSMAKLEIQRRLDVVERRLSESSYLAGPDATLADLRWWFEIDALQKAGFGVTAPNTLDWVRKVSRIIKARAGVSVA